MSASSPERKIWRPMKTPSRCASETAQSQAARDPGQGGIMPRTAIIHRKTNETDITLRLNLDGRGKARINTGVRFFDHMLELLARHGAFDLDLNARGDLDVDQHHTVEDVGITLGEAARKALGSKRGILRAGYFQMPMDETLAAAAVDLSGRPYCVVKAKIKAERVGEFQVELLEDFFGGF